MKESTLGAQKKIVIGKKDVIESSSPKEGLAVAFEDNGETGYFYALIGAKEKNPIADAMNIYDVSAVPEKDTKIDIAIIWSPDGKCAALLIDEQPNAVFDFDNKKGYCRTAFPEAGESWSRHEWDDDLRDLFY